MTRINAPGVNAAICRRQARNGAGFGVNQPVQIIFVGVPDAASNKRVYRREPAQPIPHRNGHWPLNHPVPDAETRRHLDTRGVKSPTADPKSPATSTPRGVSLPAADPKSTGFLRGGSGL